MHWWYHCLDGGIDLSLAIPILLSVAGAQRANNVDAYMLAGSRDLQPAHGSPPLSTKKRSNALGRIIDHMWQPTRLQGTASVHDHDDILCM